MTFLLKHEICSSNWDTSSSQIFSAPRSIVGLNVPFIGARLGLKRINVRTVDIPCSGSNYWTVFIREHKIDLDTAVKFSWEYITNKLFGYFNWNYPYNKVKFLVWYKTIPNSFPTMPYPLEGEAAERILTPLFTRNLTMLRESNSVLCT